MNEKILKTLILILISLTITGLATAEDPSLEIYNIEQETVWEQTDYTIQGTATCNEEETEVTLNSDEDSQTIEEGTEVEFELTASGYGEQEIQFECGGTEESFVFYLNHVESFGFEGYDQDEYFNGDRLEVDTELNLEREHDISESEITLDEMNIRGEDGQELNNQQLEEINGNQITFSGEIPSFDEIDPGERDLEVEITFNGIEESFISTEPFEVQDRWDFTITTSNVTEGNVEVSEIDTFESFMTIQIDEQGEPATSISEDQFYLESEDTTTPGSIDGIHRGNGEYEIQFNTAPNVEIGEYNYEIGIEEGEDQIAITDFILLNYISFEGRILDHHEDGVDTQIDLIGDSEAWREIHAGTKSIDAEGGFYQANVLPDLYNLSLTFEDSVTFEMQDTDLTETGQENINYDTIPRSSLEDEVEGVNIVRAMGILYGYSFEDGMAQINYEHGDVTADDAQILECEEWYMSRDCESGWERIDRDQIDINPTDPHVRFPVNPQTHGNQSFLMTGYALVENTDLVADVELESSRVPLGESVTFEGDVSTPSGGSVEDVNVEIEVLDGEEVISTQSAETNQNGVFGLTVSAPDTEGTYDIRVTAEKEPFNGFEMSESGVIDTYIERSVDVSGSDQIEIPTGQTVEEEYTVINDGQSDLDDISMYLNGINNEWYDIQGVEENLDEGSSFTATIEIEAPEDYFSEENLENENFDVEVRAMSDGEEINTIFDGVATITNEHVYQQDGDSQEEGDGMSLEAPEIPTGDFLAAQSSLNIALALITIFTLVLATAVKKKKEENDSDRSSRNVMSSSGNQLTSSNKGQQSSRVAKPKITSKDHDKKTEKTSQENQDQNKEKQRDEDKTEQKEEINETSEEEESIAETEENTVADSNGEDSMVCDVCGEEFDTESGLELHKKALH